MGFVKSRGFFSYEISIDENSCIRCGRCIKVCPRSEILFEKNESEQIALKNPQRCGACMECKKACPTEAISIRMKKKVLNYGP